MAKKAKTDVESLQKMIDKYDPTTGINIRKSYVRHYDDSLDISYDIKGDSKYISFLIDNFNELLVDLSNSRIFSDSKPRSSNSVKDFYMTPISIKGENNIEQIYDAFWSENRFNFDRPETIFNFPILSKGYVSENHIIVSISFKISVMNQSDVELLQIFDKVMNNISKEMLDRNLENINKCIDDLLTIIGEK